MTAPRRDQDSVCQGRIAERVGLLGSSLSLALAELGPACGVPNLFQPNLSNPSAFVHTTPSPETKAPHKGAFAFLAERVGLLGSSLSLAPRCARGQPPAVQFCSRQNCRTPVGSSTPLLPQKRKRPTRGRLRFWRREWDSNPRYGKPYAGFQVRCFRPLSHLSVSTLVIPDAAQRRSGICSL